MYTTAWTIDFKKNKNKRLVIFKINHMENKQNALFFVRQAIFFFHILNATSCLHVVQVAPFQPVAHVQVLGPLHVPPFEQAVTHVS